MKKYDRLLSYFFYYYDIETTKGRKSTLLEFSKYKKEINNGN